MFQELLENKNADSLQINFKTNFKILFVLIFSSFLLSSCVTDSDSGITILIKGVVSGPGKINSTQWDGTGTIDDDTWKAFSDLATAVTQNPLSGPATELAQFVTNLSQTYFEGPEPFGTASLDGISVNLINNTEDTYSTSFLGPPGWKNVTLTSDLRIAVEMYDEDQFGIHDFMGTFSLNSDDIQQAIDSKQVTNIWVGDQTDNQVLFLKIEVY